MTPAKPMKPSQYVEHVLITSILKGTFKPGQTLPGERTLATELGVTRPTLRETLQRMAGEGWLKITHGKTTLVNDYRKEGGLGLLATLVRHSEHLPADFVEHFLDIRCVLMPLLARKTVMQNPETLQVYLENSVAIDADAQAFMAYDWGLQHLMATLSENPLYKMILNDFNHIYSRLGIVYFQHPKAREASSSYYDRLLIAVGQRDAVAAETIVREVMQEAFDLWTTLTNQQREPEPDMQEETT